MSNVVEESSEKEREKVAKEPLREKVEPLDLEEVGYKTVLETTVTNITPTMIGGWNGYVDIYQGRCEPPRPTDVAGKARWWARSLVITAYKKETGKVINYKEAERLVSLLFGKASKDHSHASAVRVEIEPVCIKPYTIFGGSKRVNQHDRLKLRSLREGKQHHIAYEPKALSFKVKVELDTLLAHSTISSLGAVNKKYLNDFITTLVILSSLNAIFLFGIGSAVRKGLGNLIPYSITLKNADGSILRLDKEHDILWLIKEYFKRILLSARVAREMIGEVKPREKGHYCVQYLPPAGEFMWIIKNSVRESELLNIIKNVGDPHRIIFSNLSGASRGSDTSYRVNSDEIVVLMRLIRGLPARSKALKKALRSCTNVLDLRMPSLILFSILDGDQDMPKILFVAFWPHECLSSIHEKCYEGYGGIEAGCVRYVWKHLVKNLGLFLSPNTSKGPSPYSYRKGNIQNVRKGNQRYQSPRFRKSKGSEWRRSRKRRRRNKDGK